jgi:predicted nucleic acid-binding protein
LIVADASAITLGLLNDGDARERLATAEIAVPHLADAEIANALRSQLHRGRLEERSARLALDRWARLGVRRYGIVNLLGRIWELRDNLTAYDATYVALAEALGSELLTADRRLVAATGPTCQFVTVRN